MSLGFSLVNRCINSNPLIFRHRYSSCLQICFTFNFDLLWTLGMKILMYKLSNRLTIYPQFVIKHHVQRYLCLIKLLRTIKISQYLCVSNKDKPSICFIFVRTYNYSIRLASKRNRLCFSWTNLQHMYNYSKGITISFIISSKYFQNMKYKWCNFLWLYAYCMNFAIQISHK